MLLLSLCSNIKCFCQKDCSFQYPKKRFEHPDDNSTQALVVLLTWWSCGEDGVAAGGIGITPLLDDRIIRIEMCIWGNVI